MTARATLHDDLRARRRVLGAWTSLGHPSITEVFAATGVDFVGIDIEHSTISQEQAQRIIAAAQAAGVACLPRVASHQGDQIRRVLDSGADGVIVPNVRTEAEVESLIASVKYPPVGRRSYGVSRAQGYGLEFDAYVSSWNAGSTLLIQIESIEAVEVAEALIRPAAVDGVMVGPYDISGSLDIPGQLEHPRVTAACRRVVEACRRQGKACGTQIVDPTPARVAEAFAQGYTFVVLSSDVFLLWKWAERMRMLISDAKQVPARARAKARTR